MAIITTNGSFGATAAVTSTTLNAVADAATFSDPVDGTSLELKGDGKLGIKDAGVTKAKIENISAPLRVLGRTTAGAGVPEEVTINDNDDLSGASAITLATDESIKAYVDTSKTSAFTPSTYNGEDSVTFPNGLIMKWGISFLSSGTATVAFPVAFPNACINITANGAKADSSSNLGITAFDKLGFTSNNASVNIDYHWQAIGY